MKADRVRGVSSGWSLSVLGPSCIVLALAASLMLALQHLAGTRLPGCALDSPCRRALEGPFGTIPGLGWPVAFAGVSFFAALLVARLVAGPRGTRRLFWIVRAGALVSLGFLVVAFQQGTPCPYCIVAHLANLGFWLLWERRRPNGFAPRAERAFVLVLVASTIILAVTREVFESRDEAAAQAELDASTREMIAAEGEARAFTGRYRRGPERAALRLVLFTDYQCGDCARIEGEAWAQLSLRDDMSLSIKHFPLCKDCNRRARELDHSPHPNACWAARAAEAVGSLYGPDAFWRMHRWLFERGGSFTSAQLRDGFRELGFDPALSVKAMHAPQTLDLVLADVEEALALGIQSTPMVFLNGVELRGWRAAGALRRALETLAASKPPAALPEDDRPANALQKALEDWRLGPELLVPVRASAKKRASMSGIVLWSDYLDEATRELDGRLRAYAAARPEVDYSFRHYPLDPACVPGAPAQNPGACVAARAAEAARSVGGEDGFWRLHERLMAIDGVLDDTRVIEEAARAGLDAQRFAAALEDPSCLALVRADAAAARRLGVHSIPFLMVARRHVPRWRLEGTELLESLLEEAFEGR